MKKDSLATAFYQCFCYEICKAEDCLICYDTDLHNFAVAAGPANGFELPTGGGIFKPGIFEIILV